ncbi:MAG: Rnase Y domain-containing protein, partial [Candidatus Omnitrophica bacterium]|nr:Rnase Y domain-containing protein [Candidatus Omnitrophota bacterium]
MSEEVNIYAQSIILSVIVMVSVLAGYLLRWYFANKKLRDAQAIAKDIVDQAKRESENRKKEIELHGKDMMLNLRQEFEDETRERRDEAAALEKRLTQKEENLDKRVDLLERKEK